jgi:para-nitrobenzyl esterase
MKRISGVALIAILIICFGNVSGAQALNKIKVDGGTITGYKNGDVTIFKGVPFAAPPVGELRWKAPQEVVKWNGVRKCVTPPPSAMQSKPVPFMMWSKEFMAPETPLSEDCLYLNIWTTAAKNNEKRPVIVWIHGGAFTGGSGTVPLYDGEEMAKKGVVFVTINYRLGVFGFLAHPELSAESPDKVSGNYGILDQIAALKWVKRNIAAFGGDPDNVTIDGQSAGSFSVHALMCSPLTKGLFQRAIGQSGGMFATDNSLVSDLKTAEAAGAKIVGQAGASNIKELRLMPAEELLKTQGRWGITIDRVVVMPADEVFGSGKQNDVALITGWNADDGFSMGPAQKAEAYKANVLKTYGDRAGDFLKLFPAGDDAEAQRSQKLVAQMFFGWQNYNWAKMQSATGKSKAYLYYFTHVPPGEPNYGAFHSSEFGYALRNLKLWSRPFAKLDYDLSEIMSSYWVNFAKSGNPNGPGLPEWPAFDNSSPRVIELGDQVKPVPLPHREQLEFMSRINHSGWFTVKEVGKNVWQIDDHKAANIYLVEGNDSALVIDTGLGSADLASVVRKLTGKPLIVVNTHGHPDHTGANYQFEKVYIHPADMAAAKATNTPENRAGMSKTMLQGQKPTESEVYKGEVFDTKLLPVREGYTFRLGGRNLRVIETPGHTSGEICLLDIENKLLFTGDNNNVLVWLFLPACRPLHEYLASLEKQEKMLDDFTTIFPGHGIPMSSDFIKDQISCVRGILDKSLEAKPYKSFAGDSMVSTFGKASVAFDPGNL